ncbi:enoyl-CoA hydratase/isomerase family protein [Streptomyces olivochromogenes]|uniref:enoyl-CoA hydratase/isomerase family protein n=1 Tax=Streptomyces olivochromogenes TaxID=1963 RepID=UPI0036D91143
MEPQLLHSVGDGVATVVIHHPAKRNAMTADMWRALPPLLDGLAADPDVRVLVLTGEGGTFCAGADISTLRGSSDEAQGLAVNAEEALAAFPKPTLAAIRGYCVGGGSQLAAACDLRFAEEGARFGVTPAKLGIVYAASATRRLVSLVGPATAKYLLFSGELIDTERALRTGLVDEVLPEGELDKRVGEFTRVLAARSLLTQASAKEFAQGRTDRDAYWAEQARGSDDTAEGVAAFLERRPPRFTWTTPTSTATAESSTATAPQSTATPSPSTATTP